MAKAKFTLPSGTVVELDGAAEDIKDLLDHYGGTNPSRTGTRKATPSRKKAPKKTSPPSNDDKVDLAMIVNQIKNSDEAEAIEEHILDQKSQLNRVLLPLYIVHEQMGNAFGLTSGDINKISIELGVPIKIQNVSSTLSGDGSKYVMGDKVREKGKAVHYRLNRRGVKSLQKVLAGN